MIRCVPSIAVLMLLFTAIYGSGIGASPGTLKFENVLRGSYAEKTILVSNPDTTPIEVLVSSSSDWFNFSTTNFTVEGKSSYRLVVYLRTPDDVANGMYNGTIDMAVTPTSSINSGMGMVIAVGVTILTSVKITDNQTLSGKVVDIGVKDAEVGNRITFSVTFLNQGNVKARPAIQIDLLSLAQGKEPIRSATFNENEVLPSKTEALQLFVNSSGMAPGQYWANVSVSLGGTPLTSRQLTFDILEKGTLAAEGELVEVRSDSWVNVKEIVKISAVFKNTGDVKVSAKFKGEVFSGENLVANLESDELEVDSGETATLPTYFTPTETGSYTVSGFVVYSKKTTETKSSIINVNQPAGSGQPQSTASLISQQPMSILLIGGYISLGIALVSIVGVMLAGTLKKREEKRRMISWKNSKS
jgi:hypothetical protein